MDNVATYYTETCHATQRTSDGKFKDSKTVIRSHKSKKSRQNKDKKTKAQKQKVIYKTLYRKLMIE